MIVTLVWLAGWLLAVWPIWNLLFNDDDYDPTDSTDVIFTGGISVIAAVVWPAVLVGWAMWRISKAAWGRILEDRETSDAQ